MFYQQPFSLLKVSGNDPATFLQGQLTCDVSQLADKQACLAGHCDHKGRLQSVSWLFCQGDSYWLFLPDDLIDTAKKQLDHYALFSKITLTQTPAECALSELIASTLALTPELSREQWQRKRFEEGIALIHPETLGLFTPHHLSLPKVGAVSFTKGCFTGQEIIARTEHLGKNKRELVLLEAQSPIDAPLGGQIFNNTQAIGKIVDILDGDRPLIQASLSRTTDDTPLFLKENGGSPLNQHSF